MLEVRTWITKFTLQRTTSCAIEAHSYDNLTGKFKDIGLPL